MPVSEQTYRAVVLEDPEALWELHDGRLREKPRMGAEHNDVIARLAVALGNQLDWRVHRLRINSTHVRRSAHSYYIPDLVVVPTTLFRAQTGQPGQLEVYEAPLPLVIEVWSPTTGGYDVDEKLPAYQRRGDREIWRLHPVRAHPDRLAAAAGRDVHGRRLSRRPGAVERSPGGDHRPRRAVRLLIAAIRHRPVLGRAALGESRLFQGVQDEAGREAGAEVGDDPDGAGDDEFAVAILYNVAACNEAREAVMPVSEQTYRAVVLEDPEALWELHDGRLREKPRMGAEHNDVIATLAGELYAQLDRQAYRLRINSTHVRRSAHSYYIPDLVVVPTTLFRAQTGQPGQLEVYEAPLPLVIEVWSPTTGGYDVDEKLPAYQRRGDREIWRLHPYERTLTAWRRQPDGTYAVALYRGGQVHPVALPNVTIDLDLIFDVG